jgi:Glycosyltransferase family 87
VLSRGRQTAGGWWRRVDTVLTPPLARLLTAKPDVDGRLLVLTGVLSYFAAVTVARLLWSVNLWPWLGVPPGPSLFFDARNITAALECRRLGHDPLVDNPCDPWGRPMFYTRAWLLLRWLGLDHSHTTAFGILIVLLFLAAVCLLLQRIPAGEGVVVALAVCSPAVMLAVERANMDLILFSILCSAVVVWRGTWRTSWWLSPLLVLVAAIGKLYPIFGLAAYLAMRRRSAALVAVGCALAFLAYVALTLEDIKTIASTATQGQFYSYGARILIGQVYHWIVGHNWQGGSMAAQVAAMVPVALLAAFLWTWARRHLGPGSGQEPPAPTAKLLAFYLGTLVYVGTFAIFRNYDYRLVYLLLTLPQLVNWISDERPGYRRRVLASLGLAAVLLDLWIGTLSEYLNLADELVSWAVAGLLISCAAGAAPRLSELLTVKPTGSAQDRM